MSSPDDSVGTVIADLSNSAYTEAGGNSFSYGECTWYCWGRAKEKYGHVITFSKDTGREGGNWYNLVNNFTKHEPTWTPVPDCIASFSDSGSGHVVYIETVKGSNIYFTEAHSWCANGQLQKKTLTEFKTLWGKTLNGYISLQIE
jgi:surface antigen